MDWDDLEPRKQTVQLKNLDVCSIEELTLYIDDLKKEIERAQAMIEKKKDVKAGANSLFNS